jgi:hypothetical protein
MRDFAQVYSPSPRRRKRLDTTATRPKSSSQPSAFEVGASMFQNAENQHDKAVSRDYSHHASQAHVKDPNGVSQDATAVNEASYANIEHQEGIDLDATHAAPGALPTPPPIDERRRSRSPGLQNNFYDTSTTDFKQPYGTGNGATSPPATEVSSNAGSAGPVQIGEEAPMPGREEEYTAFKAQEAAAPPGPPFVPPPIDDTRRNKSPGIQNNFYDTDVADFKRPYGFGRGPAPPPPAAQPPPAASPEE